MKGLLDLVEAWSQLKPTGWRVVIAGRDEAGHESEVKTQIRKRKLEASFEFAGPVDGAAKWELYRSADVFVLPSHSENFGIVVAEALACGVPVITTRGAPWQELLTHRCGWWVPIGLQPLAEALRVATALSSDKRRAMGERGRALVCQKYSWAAIARQMREVYEWIAGRGARPASVLSAETFGNGHGK